MPPPTVARSESMSMRSPLKTSVPLMLSMSCGKPGELHLRVLQLGGAGERRCCQRSASGHVERDVAVGAHVRHEQLQQRGFERRP